MRLVFGTLLAAIGVANAQDNTFTWGAGNNFWDNPDGSVQYSNWSNDPLGSGAFLIGADPTNTFNFTQIQAATFTGTYLSSTVGLTISGGGLNLTSGTTSTIGADLNVSGGSLNSAGAISLTGNLNLSSGSVTSGGSGLTVGGQFAWGGGTLGSGGTVNAGVVGFATADNQVLTNQGALNISGASTWANNGTDLLNFGGAITIASSGSVAFTGISTPTGSDPNTFAATGAGIEGGSVTNYGLITLNILDPGGFSSLAGAGDYFELDNFDNEGTIDATATGQDADFLGIDSFLNAGTIKIGSYCGISMGGENGPFVNSGTIEVVGAGTSLYLYSYGTPTILNSGTISVSGASIASIVPIETLLNTGTIALSNGASFEIDSGTDFDSQGTVTISGAGSRLDDNANLDNSGTITVEDGGILNIAGQFNNQSSYANNTGCIVVSGSNSIAAVNFYEGFSESGFPFTNSGSISVKDGATFIVQASVFTNSGKITVDGSSGGIASSFQSWFGLDNPGKITVRNGGDLQVPEQVLDNTGEINIGSGSTAEAAVFVQTGSSSITRVDGTLTVSGGITLGTGVAGDGGTLTGGGKIVADVTNYSGTIAPGDPQILTVTGNYSQLANGVFSAAVDGNGGPGAADGYDQLAVGGNVSLAGAIDINTNSLYTGGLLTLFTYGGTFTKTGPLTVQDLTQPGLHFALLSDSGGAVTFQVVPEPSSYLAVGMGLGLLALARRKKNLTKART